MYIRINIANKEQLGKNVNILIGKFDYVNIYL